MKNLLNNWKTTSAGALMIGGSIIHLVFQIKAHNANENTWTITLTGVLGGLGLLLAGDASASQPKDPNPPTTPPASTDKPNP